MSTRRTATLRRAVWIVAACLAWAGSAGAQKVVPLESPRWFTEAFAAYAYRDTVEDSVTDGTVTYTLAEQTLRSWQIGGLATLNAGRGFGGRLRVFGGSTRLAQGTLRAESGEVTFRTEGFWRDPTRGQVGAGYAYSSISPDAPSPFTGGSVHGLPVFASLYMPDLGGGAVDWNASFLYTWTELEGFTGPVRQWAYDLRGGSIWYVNRFLAIDGGLRYLRAIQHAQPFDLLEGNLGLELLIPGGRRNYGTVALGGSFGRIENSNLPPPFTSMARFSWEIGITATVMFPGVDSLIELNRAYR